MATLQSNKGQLTFKDFLSSFLCKVVCSSTICEPAERPEELNPPRVLAESLCRWRLSSCEAWNCSCSRPTSNNFFSAGLRSGVWIQKEEHQNTQYTQCYVCACVRKCVYVYACVDLYRQFHFALNV